MPVNKQPKPNTNNADRGYGHADSRGANTAEPKPAAARHKNVEDGHRKNVKDVREQAAHDARQVATNDTRGKHTDNRRSKDVRDAGEKAKHHMVPANQQPHGAHKVAAPRSKPPIANHDRADQRAHNTKAAHPDVARPQARPQANQWKSNSDGKKPPLDTRQGDRKAHHAVEPRNKPAPAIAAITPVRANAAAHKGVEGAVEKADGRKMTRHVAFRPQHESPAAPEAAPARVPALEYRVYFRETRVECVYGAPNTNEFGSN
ncbi:hypothetical protein AcW1_007984 [Taiwanofungus camphoratus]|nr:hypothetical protein AcV5_008277 [Antrodia cinnamomea]KAI0950762.1 hypothetical protein AcW1_007984 [Antrodia cinnamomea]KAI0955673.1 hypothetical protein AcV7_006273 [Antrodia cinnamomea]